MTEEQRQAMNVAIEWCGDEKKKAIEQNRAIAEGMRWFRGSGDDPLIDCTDDLRASNDNIIRHMVN